VGELSDGPKPPLVVTARPLYSLLSSFFIVLPVLSGSACSRTDQPNPGDAGYRYNLAGHYASDMTVRDTRYTGSMELATLAGGAVSGMMKLTAPITITAELTGSVNGDSVIFGGPYRTPDCTGVLRARGRVADGGGSAWGTVNIDDGCAGGMAGRFRLER
jgi:hypothetical protein